MLTTIATLWLLHLVATITPGANTLLVSQLAASGHRQQALFAAFGVAIASATWAALAVLGVGVVFNVFPVLRLALQLSGGLYLLYLAARLWSSGSSGVRADGSSVTTMAALRMGMLTNFTNPKAALFFGSIFSASFPVTPGLTLLTTAVVVVFANALCWYGLLAYLFSRDAVRVAYVRNCRAASRAAGLMLGAFGLRVLLQSVGEARP